MLELEARQLKTYRFFYFRKVCPLCKRTVLPSYDSDDSDSEEAPLLRNERVEHQNEGIPDRRLGKRLILIYFGSFQHTFCLHGIFQQNN